MLRTAMCGSIFSLLIGIAVCNGQDVQRYTQGKFGVGFVVGEPTGIAWKYRLDPAHAVDGAIGISPNNQFRMHVDYLWQSHPFNERNLALHYGAGVAFGSGRTYLRTQEVGFGLRGVGGVDYMIRNTPLDLFFELGPMLLLTPNSGSGVDLGFGARVFF